VKESYEINPASGCWEWTGYIDRNGYGRLYDRSAPKGQRTEWAHRAFYRRQKGPIPDRYEVDHVCQNTKCVNPEHLDAVSKAEHAARTMRRLGKDERHKSAAVLRGSRLKYREIAEALNYAGRAGAHDAVMKAIDKGLISADDVPKPTRLNDEEREEVRDLYAAGVPQTEIAAWYGIDSSAVSRICNHLETRKARAERGLAS
jgi:hypothetical protein